jgi:L-threonylcarbamoyladenylate synthase
MQTQIEKITSQSIERAKQILEQGGVVAIPTETVYGLGAIGTNPTAVTKIFEIKGRPSDNPLIAHVHKDYDLNKLVKVEHGYVFDLMKAYMPGPLTLVFNSKGVVCKEAVCGGQTLAVRMPSHKGCQELLKAIDKPIVAPSANLSKHTSPVTAEHVYNDLNGKIPLILDGGKCSGGIESTVLDCTESVPRILRAGLITKEMIESVTGACLIAEHKEGDRVKSPGVKYSHYMPKTETARFTNLEIDKAKALYKEYLGLGKDPYIMCDDEIAKNFVGYNILSLGKNSIEMANNLYDRLLEGEKKASIIIAVYKERSDGVYMGVLNRLKKSCEKR